MEGNQSAGPVRVLLRGLVGLAALSLATLVLAGGAAEAGAVGTGAISGHVTFEGTGAVPSDGEVCVLGVPDSGYFTACVPVDPVTGAYEILGLEASYYQVYAVSPSHQFATEYADGNYGTAVGGEVTVGDSSTSVVDFSVAAGGTIRGTVTEESTGAPIALQHVCAVSPPNSWQFCVETEADGTYEIAGLPPIPLTVQFGLEDYGLYTPEYWDNQSDLSSAQQITFATPTEIVSGIDAQLGAQGSVSGVVTDSVTGAPLGTYRVCLQAVDSNDPYCVDYTPEFTAFLGLPPGGYSIPYARPGEYTLTVFGDASHRGEHWDDQSLSGIPGLLTVTSGGSTVANVALDPLRGVFGKVLESNWNEPLTDQTVCVYQGGAVVSCVTTAPDGSFEFPELPTGSYTLGVTGSYEFLALFWSNANSLDTAQPFEVVQGVDNEPFVFRLEYGWGIPEVTTTTSTTSTSPTSVTTATTATSTKLPVEDSTNPVTTTTSIPATLHPSTTATTTAQMTTRPSTLVPPNVLGAKQHASAPRAKTGASVAPILALATVMLGAGLALVLAERRRGSLR